MDKEPAGRLTRREVTQEIHRRGDLHSSLHHKGPDFNVTWNYDTSVTKRSPGRKKAKKKAKKQMMNFLSLRDANFRWNNISIT